MEDKKTITNGYRELLLKDFSKFNEDLDLIYKKILVMKEQMEESLDALKDTKASWRKENEN